MLTRLLTVCLLAMTLLLGHLATACVYNSECGSGRCREGVCVTEECILNIQCLSHGPYFKCERGKCVPSKKQMCKSDADCKKNFFRRKCKKSRCA